MAMQVGDMVWGKVKSHPWWPGEICSEDFSSDAVCQKKKKGYVLVSFYGDYTCWWFDPAQLIPFDLNYDQKSKQTSSPDFLKAVDHALYEVRKRATLGFSCRCRNPSIFQPTNVEGFVKVDVSGYDPGAVYSTDQIKTARNGFEPLGFFSFIKKLASSPINDLRRDIDMMKNVARVLAYRSSVFEEFDETYAQAFGVKPIRPVNALTQAPVPLGSVNPEPTYKHKVSATKTKRVKLNEPEKKVETPPAAPIPQVKQKGIAKKASSVGIKEKETLIDMNIKKPSKENSFDEPMMLFMNFPRGSRLPSISELKAKFARFGPIDTSSVCLYWKSLTCRLIFLQKTDAESAYSYAVNGNIFGDTNVVFQLVELENGTEIVTTNSSLKKLDGVVGSTSASTEDLHVKYVVGKYMRGYKSIEEFVDAVNKKHLRIREMNSQNN